MQQQIRMHSPTPSPTASATVLLLFFAANESVTGASVVVPGRVAVVVVGAVVACVHAAMPNLLALPLLVYAHAHTEASGDDAEHVQVLDD